MNNILLTEFYVSIIIVTLHLGKKLRLHGFRRGEANNLQLGISIKSFQKHPSPKYLLGHIHQLSSTLNRLLLVREKKLNFVPVRERKLKNIYFFKDKLKLKIFYFSLVFCLLLLFLDCFDFFLYLIYIFIIY